MENLNKDYFYSGKYIDNLKPDLISYLKQSSNIVQSINDVLHYHHSINRSSYDYMLIKMINGITEIVAEHFIDKKVIEEFIKKDLLIEKENRQFLEVTYAHNIIADYVLKNTNIDEIKKQARENSDKINWLFHNATHSILLATNFVNVVLEENSKNQDGLKYFCNNFHKLKILNDNNVNVWSVINKDDEYNVETLYPSFVWHKERVLSKIKGFKEVIHRKVEFFQTSKDIWMNINTEKTNNVDLYSRMLITLLRGPEEKYIYDFLKKNKINKFSLYIKDFNLSIYENKPIKKYYCQLIDGLIEKKYIKTLNYLYGENDIDLSGLINGKTPNKVVLPDIQLFLKVMKKNDKFEFETSNELLKSYIEKKSFYSPSFKSLQKIYFPINAIKLQEHKDLKFTTWRDVDLVFNYNGYEKLDKQIQSVNNFFTYLDLKINWNEEQTITLGDTTKTYKNQVWFFLIRSSLKSINKEDLDKEVEIFKSYSAQERKNLLYVLKDFLMDKSETLAGHKLMCKFLVLLSKEQVKLSSDFFDDKFIEINEEIKAGFSNSDNVELYEKIILKLNMDSMLEQKSFVKKEKVKI